jgi:hypothetical protein
VGKLANFGAARNEFLKIAHGSGPPAGRTRPVASLQRFKPQAGSWRYHFLAI